MRLLNAVKAAFYRAVYRHTELCMCKTPPVHLIDHNPKCESCSKPVTDYEAVKKEVINTTLSHAIAKQNPKKITHEYQYGRINEDETRLMVLYPGSYEDDLHCTLVPASLHDLPEFDAMSYTWADESGDKTISACIYCGKERRTIAITKNCEAMLRRVRLPKLKRLVWVDAVCINQECVVERNHQVRSMSKIYRGASGVLIYLGEEISRLFSSPFEPHGYSSTSAPARCMATFVSAIENRPLYMRFVEKHWFSRIWVLQEAAMARRGEWICGNRHVELACFSLSTWRRYLTIVPLSLNSPGVFHLIGDAPFAGQSLWDLVQDSRLCNSTDPRDRIYALRSLVPDISEDELVPDYHKSTAEVYIEAAVYLVQKHRSPNILFLRIGWRVDYDMPSWIPDFSSVGFLKQDLYDDEIKAKTAESSRLPVGSITQENMASVSFPTNQVLQPRLNISAVCLGTLLHIQPHTKSSIPHVKVLLRGLAESVNMRAGRNAGLEVLQMFSCCLEDWSNFRPMVEDICDLVTITSHVTWLCGNLPQNFHLSTLREYLDSIPTPELELYWKKRVGDNCRLQSLKSALDNVCYGANDTIRDLVQALFDLADLQYPQPYSEEVLLALQQKPEGGHFSLAHRWHLYCYSLFAPIEEEAMVCLMRRAFKLSVQSPLIRPKISRFAHWTTSQQSAMFEQKSWPALLVHDCGASPRDNSWDTFAQFPEYPMESVFYTKYGLGHGPACFQLGDAVMSILGASHFAVFRPFADGYKYIGPCFLFGQRPFSVGETVSKSNIAGGDRECKGECGYDYGTEAFDPQHISVY